VKTNSLTQLTFEFQHWLQQMEQRPQVLTPLLKRLQRSIYQFGSNRWLLGGLGILLLWVWIWQWVLSVAVGGAVMIGVYLAQQRQLKFPRQSWRRLWSRTNRAATIAALSGLATLASTYLVTAVWLETEQHWLAISILLEGGGILTILALLLRQTLKHSTGQNSQTEVQFQSMLADLSHPDSLKRLIAIRQITQLLTRAADQSPQLLLTPAQVTECFRLMLDRETEPLVCNALIESLQQLNPTRQLAASQLTPMAIKQIVHQSVKQRYGDRDL
jgi:hypothetical protein